jgi:SAM-dependent methyltransferase
VCNAACIDFGRRNLTASDIEGRAVIEIGSRDDNGSLRKAVTALGPARYLGVDIAPGPGVDELCDATQLVSRYGPESFDVVLTTEMLEHVENWRDVIRNLKAVLRPGGILLLTTRSPGYPYHGAPFDFWRYEPADIRAIFADFDVETLERDPTAPGVFARVRKTATGAAPDLTSYALYSIITGHRSASVGALDKLRSWLRWPRRLAARIAPDPLRSLLRKLARNRR